MSDVSADAWISNGGRGPGEKRRPCLSLLRLNLDQVDEPKGKRIIRSQL